MAVSKNFEKVGMIVFAIFVLAAFAIANMPCGEYDGRLMYDTRLPNWKELLGSQNKRGYDYKEGVGNGKNEEEATNAARCDVIKQLNYQYASVSDKDVPCDSVSVLPFFKEIGKMVRFCTVDQYFAMVTAEAIPYGGKYYGSNYKPWMPWMPGAAQFNRDENVKGGLFLGSFAAMLAAGTVFAISSGNNYELHRVGAIVSFVAAGVIYVVNVIDGYSSQKVLTLVYL